MKRKVVVIGASGTGLCLGLSTAASSGCNAATQTLRLGDASNL